VAKYAKEEVFENTNHNARPKETGWFTFLEWPHECKRVFPELGSFSA
jgi:hypothetical protein